MTGEIFIYVIEQYNGYHPTLTIQRRLLKNSAADGISNDGRAFSVILL
jgi:hypothetical protein